ncbi:MAG: class I SAM-dependent methyltransferase [Verrucomicrobiales bacterium]|nr:class I SAM-dependent methyltransferase [Verrucomicrobiales bacterium]MCP5559467.1 class I SAM-dependent methyltransferase [Verrucomicrobiaceae bacterium]
MVAKVSPGSKSPTESLGEFEKLLQAVDVLRSRGGPSPEEYAGLNRLIRRTGDEIRTGMIDQVQVKEKLTAISLQHFAGTLQANAISKPHGYSGDFEMIDAIYRLAVSPEPRLRRWDLFFHAQSAPCAVRNRKIYFMQLLDALMVKHAGQRRVIKVLNVGSGPARDVFEWLCTHPKAEVRFECVDLDPKAISFGRTLCSPFGARVMFHHQNALKSVPSAGYDLVWCAGLFDYLSGRVATRLLRALLAVAATGAEVVVGNFSQFNPSRDYMEIFGDWFLEHRSEGEMREIALAAGGNEIDVTWEPEGVNLFVHCKRSVDG